MNAKNLLAYFENRQPETERLIETLVNIESPSFDIDGSASAVKFVAQEAQKISGVDSVERISVENVGEHLVIRAFENLREKPILLLGHTDTVHPRGSYKKNPTRIDNEKFFGCGIFDMKANVVLMLEVLRSFEEFNLKPNRPITILLSCDEEVGSETGRAMVEREAANSEFCLVCEPSANGKVKTGRKGTGMFQITAHGVPAHAGLEPEKGASAILELSKQIPQIHALTDYEKGTSANVCLMSGGTASNVIPEYAECTVDVRFTTMTEAARIEREIRNLKSSDAKVSLEINGKINRPPLERNEKTLKLYEQAKEIAGEMNYEFGETQVGGASDGNFVAALGVPVLDGLGISGGGAHTNEEFIFVADIAKRIALVASFVLRH